MSADRLWEAVSEIEVESLEAYLVMEKHPDAVPEMAKIMNA